MLIFWGLLFRTNLLRDKAKSLNVALEDALIFGLNETTRAIENGEAAAVILIKNDALVL